MKKLRCILLDEDEDQLSLLKSKLSGLPEVEIAASFTDSREFLKSISMLPSYDLLITDIDMPGFDGFEVARKIDPQPVLFVTGYPEKGIDYSEVPNAIGAIKKPVRLEMLTRLLKQITPTQNTVVLKTDRGKAHEIEIQTIAYIKTADKEPRDKEIHFRDGHMITAKTIKLDDLISHIASPHVLKANNSEALHTNHIVARLSTYTVGVACGSKIIEVEVQPEALNKIKKVKPHLFHSN
ncbi:MAG: response regulator [Bacteroidetes bacterium]|nr:response regulator [Bacteroidota bacterium]